MYTYEYIINMYAFLKNEKRPVNCIVVFFYILVLVFLWRMFIRYNSSEVAERYSA